MPGKSAATFASRSSGVLPTFPVAMPVEWLRGPADNNAALDSARCFDDLYELACWLRGARIFVGNDSGISHLAAAVGTPVLVFFSASDPRIWSPRGPAVQAAAKPTETLA
jgi:ADP-heptose:LPS heptosyltransferase